MPLNKTTDTLPGAHTCTQYNLKICLYSIKIGIPWAQSSIILRHKRIAFQNLTLNVTSETCNTVNLKTFTETSISSKFLSLLVRSPDKYNNTDHHLKDVYKL